jgi:hypothetical protein
MERQEILMRLKTQRSCSTLAALALACAFVASVAARHAATMFNRWGDWFAATWCVLAPQGLWTGRLLTGARRRLSFIVNAKEGA